MLNNRLANEIARGTAMVEHEEELTGNKDNLLNENAQLRNEIHGMEESIEGLRAEAKFDKQKLTDLMTEVLERNDIIGGLRNNLGTLLEQSERLEANCDMLTTGLQRNLERARTDIAERDVLINRYRNTLNIYQDERDIARARYMIEQHNTRTLTRQRLALRIANRQLQIRLLNPPVVIPPPIPQPPLPNISWLMLH
jgi:chromosome segregation ATPase